MGTINEKLDRFKEDAHALEHEMEQYEDDLQYLLTEIRDLLTEIKESETIKKGKGKKSGNNK